MVEIERKKTNNCDIVSGYEIKNSNNGEIIDFVQKVYTDKNQWNKKNVFSAAIVYRRNLRDVLDYFGVTKDAFENAMRSESVDIMAIFDMIDSTIGNEYHIELPKKFVEGVKGDFDPYDDSNNETLTVVINRNDYSSLFDDFDIFDEEAAQKAYDVLCSGNYIEVDNDLSDLEHDLNMICSDVFINGLLC